MKNDRESQMQISDDMGWNNGRSFDDSTILRESTQAYVPFTIDGHNKLDKKDIRVSGKEFFAPKDK